MKVGTDSILLGAWTNVENAERILDIGTGTGVIALMLAQKSNATIDAIEIDRNSYLEAEGNIKNSKWKERINVNNIALQDFIKITDTKKYDVIVCNPPYFINSLKSKMSERNLARHNISLNYTDLISAVSELISVKGRFYVIIPYIENGIFISEALKYSIYSNKKLYIQPKENSKLKRLLIEFSKVEKPCEENTLIIENEQRHHYTNDYKELTNEYYLSFKY
jgi:tRNA1Val (adenine37-N6)-methyltransferase